ncbi:GNAT family N-acetyltransferase [Marinomonas sp. PE14-40]|uniref:GNAT family N-acetyltransferase n=1 Tax=Marinomonas sp. PE14-40 TaxID=3060621 RepID=UPI003F676D94
MNICIREANTTEAELLTKLALESKAHWGYDSDFMKACEEELSVTAAHIMSDEITYMVYEANNEVLGFYAISQLTEIEAELDALFVKSTLIGKGIGRKLIKHAIQQVKSRGYTSIKIQSDPNAEKFYRAAGGVLVGKQKSGSIEGRYLPVLKINLESV